MLAVPCTAQNPAGPSQDPQAAQCAAEASDPVLMRLYGTGGPYAAFEMEREVASKRTATTKTFANEDGSFTWLSMSGPAHYLEDGVYKTSSPELEAYGAPHTFINRHAAVKTRYGADGITFDLPDGDRIRLVPQAMRLEAVDGSVRESHALARIAPRRDADDGQGNTLVQTGLIPGLLDLQWRQGTGQVKSGYVLHAAPEGLPAEGSLVIRERLTLPAGVAFGRTAEGLVFRRGDRELLRVSEPRLTDLSGAWSGQDMAMDAAREADGSWVLTYRVPAAWLLDPARAFPLVLDPTLTVYPTSSSGSMWTGTTNEDADAHSSDNMKVGFYDASFDNEQWMAWARFDLSGLPAHLCVTSANLELYQHVWRDGDGNNGLAFEVGWLDRDPLTNSWASIRDGINGLPERWARWDVWGTPAACSGCNGGYDFNEGCCGWDNLNVNYATFQDRLVKQRSSGFLSVGLDNIVGDYDCLWCTGDETNELEFRGWSDANRPRIIVTYTEIAQDPAEFGDGVWNVYAYRGRDWNLGGGVAYHGYYTEASLSFNTTSRWSSTGTPASASGYVGCDPGIDNHTVVSKRTNFTCGIYQLDVPSHDDETKVFVNGAQVWEHNGCCDAHTNIWTGFLGPASTVEIRHGEGGGGSNHALTITLQGSSALSGGSVGGSQTVYDGCGSASSFTDVAAASGGLGSLAYQWEFQDACTGAWAAVAAATGSTYTPPKTDGCYRRAAIDQCGDMAYSNTVTVTVIDNGDPAVFGDSYWRVYAYSGRDWDLGGGLTYLGYYDEANLSFNTADRWVSTGTPASASGYVGCDPGIDNHTLSYKRTNFACGQYAITVNTHDDETKLLVNGQQVWYHSGCCDAHANVWVGYLDASSTLEFRQAEGTGGSGLQVTVNHLAPGAIATVTQPDCDGTGSIALSSQQGGATPYFVSDFTTAPADISTFGSAAITGGSVQLTSPVNDDWGGLYLENPEGWNGSAFHASFDFRIWDGGGADGLSFNYGSLPVLAGYGPYENGVTSTGLVVTLRTYSGTMEIKYNGSVLASKGFAARSSGFRRMAVHVDASDVVTVSVDGLQELSADLTSYGYPGVDKSGWAFGFAARTGGVNDRHSLDNVYLTLLDAFEYSIDGGSAWQTSPSFTGLAAGDYETRVRAQGSSCEGVVGTLTINDNTSAGTADAYGTNTWNVSCYNGNDFGTYFGYYTAAAEEFNIGDHGIGVAGNPEDAAGYQGCTFPGNDDWSLVARRHGFPCAEYAIEGVGHDDALQVRVDADGDGNWDYDSGERGCCNILTGVLHTTVLDASSKVEIRHREVSGDTYAHVRFNDVGSALSAGDIPTDTETVCSGYDPAPIPSSTDASGGDGTLTYLWQLDVGAGSWSDVSSSNAASFDPGAFAGYGTFSYRRRVTDACGVTGTTGSKTYSVYQDVSITSSPVDVSLCDGSGTTLAASITGGYGPTLQWMYDDGGAWVPVADGTPSGATYTGATTGSLVINGLPSDGAWPYRLQVNDDLPACDDPASATATVRTETSPPAASVGTPTFQCSDNALLLSGSDPGSGLTGTWSVLSGGGSVSAEPTPGEASLTDVNPGSVVQLRYAVSTGTGICPDATADLTVDFLKVLAASTDGPASCSPDPGGGLQYVGSTDGEILFGAVSPNGSALGALSITPVGADAFSGTPAIWSGPVAGGSYTGGASDPPRMPAGDPTCPEELFFPDLFEIDITGTVSSGDPEIRLYIGDAAWDAFVDDGNTWLDAEGPRRAEYVACYGSFPSPGSNPTAATVTVTGYHADGASAHAVTGTTYDDVNGVHEIVFTTDRFSGFALHGSNNGTPLPVELVTFTGQHTAGNNHLSWITAAELNTLRFDVERSANGLAFETLGSVEAAGWSSAPRTYGYVDAGVPPGGFYYRLKVVDIDGSVEHSRTIWLSAEAGAPAQAYAQLMPNPTTAETELRFWLPSEGRYTVSVRDAVGRLVFAREGQGTEGLNRLGLDLGGEAAGTYVVTLTRPDGLNQPLRLVKSTD